MKWGEFGLRIQEKEKRSGCEKGKKKTLSNEKKMR